MNNKKDLLINTALTRALSFAPAQQPRHAYHHTSRKHSVTKEWSEQGNQDIRGLFQYSMIKIISAHVFNSEILYTCWNSYTVWPLLILDTGPVHRQKWLLKSRYAGMRSIFQKNIKFPTQQQTNFQQTLPTFERNNRDICRNTAFCLGSRFPHFIPYFIKMHRLFGKAKPKVEAPTLGDASGAISTRVTDCK